MSPLRPVEQVERWTGARVVAWAKALEGGKYAHVADCFARTYAAPAPASSDAGPSTATGAPNPRPRSAPLLHRLPPLLPTPPPPPASSGKRLSHEWELDVCKWVTAAGGTEEEGHELFEAFQKMYKEAKRAQRSARPKQQIERIVEPCVVGGDFMADGPRAAVAE